MKMDIFFQVINYIYAAVFAQALMLVFILLFLKRNNKANIFFAAFILIISLNMFMCIFMNFEIRIIDIITFIIVMPLMSLAGISIYFYTLFITGLREILSPRHLLHLLPYGITLLFAIVACVQIREDTVFNICITVSVSLGLISSICYSTYTWVMLKKYYRKIENFYSDIERMSLSWAQMLTALSSILFINGSVFFIIDVFQFSAKDWVTIALIVLDVLLVCIIIIMAVYRIINQVELFQQNIEMVHEIEEKAFSSGCIKYAKLSIDDETIDKYLEHLLRYMDEKKPYLVENITLKNLADELGIISNYLSMIINSRLNKNFYTFINEYRIKEVLSILNDPDNSDASIIAIAFRSGFNSKSSFNRIFKLITGKTPSEYRNMYALQSDPIR